MAGRFFAFDSFDGISTPPADENRFYGDFRAGTDDVNLRSFRALARPVNMDLNRLTPVPGFYGRTLVDTSPARYGLEPESVLVCVIDCDLLEPTRQVLNFVEPLLQPGALLYFDDWRLCRASPVAGERAAAPQWLSANPHLELVELFQTHWQNQYSIFNRRSPRSGFDLAPA